MELPIRMKRTGPGSEMPYTLCEKFLELTQKYSNRPALSVKRNKKWYYFNQYYIGKLCHMANIGKKYLTSPRLYYILTFLHINRSIYQDLILLNGLYHSMVVYLDITYLLEYILVMDLNHVNTYLNTRIVKQLYQRIDNNWISI